MTTHDLTHTNFVMTTIPCLVHSVIKYMDPYMYLGNTYVVPPWNLGILTCIPGDQYHYVLQRSGHPTSRDT